MKEIQVASIEPQKLQSKPPTTTTAATAIPTTTNNNSRSTTRHALPLPYPIHGFNKAVFVGQDKVVTNFVNFIRVFNISKHAYSLTDIKCEGAVACVQTSPDFHHLAVSVDAVQGAKIVMYDSVEMDKAIRDFSTIILASQIRISLTNETILLFAESEDKQLCRIVLYAFDGTFLSEISLNLPNPSNSFEISFCPADETIICVITNETCYFMRATTNLITVFSTIKFYDLSCHAWVDDVTLGFGTIDGQIRLYRETVAMEIVNLKSLQDKFVIPRAATV
uniref:Uncharacterized protein n=1 Tax=Panagrolaimus superbus TaxID=310955 RepID=A0A914Y938_9BILA